MNAFDFKDYKGLNKTNEYDKDKEELLGEAITEKLTLEKRIKYLNTLIEENKDLIPYLWTTLQGECKPLHKITDSHLKNIVRHIMERGGTISPQIRAEAISRSIELPDPEALYESRMNRMLEAEIIDRDDMDLE